MKKEKYTISDIYYLIAEKHREFNRLFGDGKDPYPLLKIPSSTMKRIKALLHKKK